MKMLSRKLAMPLLGMLLWVISIHAGSFAAATLLPHPITGDYHHHTKEDQNHNSLREKIKIPEKELNRSAAFAGEVLDGMHTLETNLGWSQVHLKKGTPSYGEFIMSQPEPEALTQGRDALAANKATINLMSRFCYKHILNATRCAKFMSGYSLASTSLGSSCKKLRKACSQEDILSPYRSFDGSCNNKNDGGRGSSFTAYKRLLHAHYSGGVEEPRRAFSKAKMPSARQISGSLIKSLGNSDNDLTLALVQWSEFIEHDLSHTPSSKMLHSNSTIECCASDGMHLSPRYMHPFCAPISVPMDDKYYSQHGVTCMSYVRSVPAIRTDCTFGPREQLNQATHYLDASQIYGATPRKAAQLRTFHKGQLVVSTSRNKHFLPLSSNPTEECQTNSICFTAGDSRVNGHPELAVFHTIWLREHNRIAKGLAKINPSWDDEKLFQEARRIVIAEIQHITYNEWLPQILGKRYLSKIQENSQYKDTVDSSVGNSFATAAIRVLNSLMDGKLELFDEHRRVSSSLALKNYFNKPGIVEEPGYLDALLRRLATQPSQKLDFRFADDLSSQLFSNGVYGYDVLSLDIQRGRDHGLPPYTSFRSLCAQSHFATRDPVHDFNELSDTMDSKTIKSLSHVYNHPHDIDLIVGGLSERPVEDSLFGPTLACIISDQFMRTRSGDRYFYTNEAQPAPFSRSQIREIEKVTLARIFCDNGDEIKKMQPDVFRRIKPGNELERCDGQAIPTMDLTRWTESREKYY